MAERYLVTVFDNHTQRGVEINLSANDLFSAIIPTTDLATAISCLPEAQQRRDAETARFMSQLDSLTTGGVVN